MGHGRDLNGQKKSGETFPVEVSLSTYTRNDERYVIAFIVDITHRKEIEESMIRQQKQLENVTNEMRRLNAELEAKVEERTVILKEALQRLEQSQEELSEALDKERQLNEIKSRFVSMASHEFRTPLSTVLSSASLLSKYTTTEDQEKRNRHIGKIKGSVKHLNDLLEDFLSLGKLDEGKVGAMFHEFDLYEVIQDTIDEMKGLVKEGQQIAYSHKGHELVESDKKLIKNILINLISNAIKFSDPGKTVYVNSEVKEDITTISVRDEGIGIAEEDQGHLFSSFFRGKNALNIQGTGLGLHIVKRYLDLLDGDVQLKSDLGKGTIITFTIPVKRT
jgi:signal transduction histidine kinase